MAGPAVKIVVPVFVAILIVVCLYCQAGKARARLSAIESRLDDRSIMHALPLAEPMDCEEALQMYKRDFEWCAHERDDSRAKVNRLRKILDERSGR